MFSHSKIKLSFLDCVPKDLLAPRGSEACGMAKGTLHCGIYHFIRTGEIYETITFILY